MISLASALAETGDVRSIVVGQVEAVDAVEQRVDVIVHGGSVRLPTSGETFAVDDLVKIARSKGGSWWILGVIGGGTPLPPPADRPPVKPPDPESYRNAPITARSTHTYRGGWRDDTSDLYQGDWTGRGRNTGVAFYGSALAGLRADPAGANNRIVLRYKRLPGSGDYSAQVPTFWTVAQRSKPGGAPTRIASFTGAAVKPGEVETVVLPDNRAAELLSGEAGGIACYVAADTPYLQLAGRAAWSAAMSLSVHYLRS